MMPPRDLLVCVLAFAGYLPTAFSQVQDGKLDTLRSVSPNSKPGTIVATPDSRYLYVVEGGGVAVIDTDFGQAAFEGSLYDGSSNGLTYLQVGRQAVLPSALLLDPDAAAPYAETSDVLYVAGGRSGLWAMQANPNGTGHATRIDDKVNPSQGDLSKQLSRRWCNDLAVFQLTVDTEVTWYLAALFSSRNKNRLRIYALQDVRDALLASLPDDDTGHEMLPLADVKIDGNSNAYPCHPPGGLTTAYAVGYGMAVDTVSPTEAHMYVALGSSGLVRVVIESAHLAAAPSGTPSVEDGPAFGNETYHDLQADATCPDLYDHYRVYDYDEDDVFEVWNEPPFFVDVAVQNTPTDHYLYAAVDHLGWLRFDLSNTWDGTIPIDHHEGHIDLVTLLPDDPVGPPPVIHPKTTHVNLIVDSPTEEVTELNVRTYARKIDVAELVIDGETESVLAVSVEDATIRRSFDPTTEGYWLGYWGERLGPYEPPACKAPPGEDSPCVSGEQPYIGTFRYTLLYRLDELTVQQKPAASPTSGNVEVVVDGGGAALYVAPSQADDDFHVFGGEGFGMDVNGKFKTDINSTFRAEIDWQTSSSIEPRLIRRTQHRPCHHHFEAGVCIGNRDLILRGGNDAGLPRNGLLYLCQDEFQVRHEPDDQPSWLVARPNDDLNGSFTLLGDPQAQWKEDPADNHIWVWSSQENLEEEPVGVFEAIATDWSISKLLLGAADLCDPQNSDWPQLGHRVFVSQIPDRFTLNPRGQTSSGTVDLAYDNHVDSVAPGFRFMFGSRVDTADGVAVMRRDLLVNEAINQETLGNHDVYLDPVGLGASVRLLDTHPEFANVEPASHPKAVPNININPQGFAVTLAKTRFPIITTGSYAPKIFKRAKDDRWLLAAPSSSVAFDAQDPRVLSNIEDRFWVDENPIDLIHDWLPDPVFDDVYSHGLLALFDIHDINMLTGNDPIIPRAYIISPDSLSDLFQVDVYQNGDDTYLFVTDFGGRLYVFDVTDVVLDTSEAPLPVYKASPMDTQIPFATWAPKLPVMDREPNNVWDVVVDASGADVFVYVSVLRLGVKILKFDPAAEPFEDSLTEEGLIQTTWRPSGLTLRDSGGERTLVVSDHGGGIRLYADD